MFTYSLQDVTNIIAEDGVGETAAIETLLRKLLDNYNNYSSQDLHEMIQNTLINEGIIALTHLFTYLLIHSLLQVEDILVNIQQKMPKKNYIY